MDNLCVCCGAIIPEGQMVCQNCLVTVKEGEKKYTLKEIAVRICNSIPAEECDHCPATLYCRAGHNGMLAWLKKVVEQ